MNDITLFHEPPTEITCSHKSGYQGVTTLFQKHNNYEIYLLLNGEVNYFLENRGYHMKKGSILFVSPDVFHRLEYLDPHTYERIDIQIKDKYFRSLNTARTNLANVISKRGNGSCVSFRLTPQQMEHLTEKSHALEDSLQWKHFGDDILSDALLKEILVYLNRLPKNKAIVQTPDVTVPPLVTDLVNYVHDHLVEDLSINALAKVFRRNGQYLSRRFRETMGIPLQQYIIHKRVDQARKYLEAGYPLTKACFSSGFRDYSNFAKTFSKYVGMPPKHYQLESMSR